LFHRISEDLDFFSEKEVYLPAVRNFVQKLQKKINLVKVDYRRFLGLHSFYLFLTEERFLKIDFNYYPFPRIEKGMIYKNIEVDSLYDIAVNKVHTISMEARARDFIDIYFILKEKGYDFKKLILDAKAKFDWHIDPVQLGTQLVKASDLSDYPRMLVKIDHNEWKEFFIKEALKLKKEIFKK
ncbi:MAG: nucleotidyl transferase AbiEii/AbiGii toxin family protein, partial [candidate division WOR-3 bacterium]